MHQFSEGHYAKLNDLNSGSAAKEIKVEDVITATF